MEKESKIINLYIDKSGALYGAPFGKSKKYGMRPIDRLFLLMPGYTDEMLCEFVNRVFDCCGSEEAKDDMHSRFFILHFISYFCAVKIDIIFIVLHKNDKQKIDPNKSIATALRLQQKRKCYSRRD